MKKFNKQLVFILLTGIQIWSSSVLIAQNSASRVCYKDTLCTGSVLTYQIRIQNTRPSSSIFRYQQFFKDSVQIKPATSAEVLIAKNGLYSFIWRPSKDSVLCLEMSIYPKDTTTYTIPQGALIEWTTSGKVYKKSWAAETLKWNKTVSNSSVPLCSKTYYLVQIATLSRPRPDLKSRFKLGHSESLIIQQQGDLYKHYIGLYPGKSNAETTLKKVRKQSDFSKSFIVKIEGKQLLKCYPYSSY